MKHTPAFSILMAVVFLSGICFGQLPDRPLVPLPDFAEYRAEYSSFMTDMYKEIGGRTEESYTTGMDHLYYESVDADVRVYTTSLSVGEVREKYFELFIEDMKEQGIPAEAVPQFQHFLEDQVIEEIDSESMADADPDVLEAYFREAGGESSLRWIECYRTLYPELQNKMSLTFLIEMDELRFQRPGGGDPPTEYTLVEVEVQQPFVDPIGCKIENATAITYSVFRMVAVDE